MNLKDLYKIPGKTVITAHRGFSGKYPENTLTAFRKAMEVSANIVEFDVRETRDGQLVVLHDATLDRTTNGTGAVISKTWEEVRKLNATYWAGTHDAGHRLAVPAGEEGIPLLTDALELLAGKVGVNIQIYTENDEALKRIAILYLKYGLEKSGFLMLRSFEEAKSIRKYHPSIQICVGKSRDDLPRHLAFGVDFMQPQKSQLTDDFLRRIQTTDIPFNVFFANTEADMRWLLERNVRGIMSDVPDQLRAIAKAAAL